MRCNQCGAENLDGANFCVSCGGKLVVPNQTNVMQNPGNAMQNPGNAMQNPGNEMQNPGNAMQNPGNMMQNPGNMMQNPGNMMQNPGNYMSNQNYMPNQNYVPNAGYGYGGQPGWNANYTPTVPPEYKPISAWGYVGWMFLFNLPIAGFIVLLVFALGGTRNINLKNYARSYFCLILLVVVVVVICSLLGVSLVNSFTGNW